MMPKKQKLVEKKEEIKNKIHSKKETLKNKLGFSIADTQKGHHNEEK